jgi:hypothetical protein
MLVLAYFGNHPHPLSPKSGLKKVDSLFKVNIIYIQFFMTKSAVSGKETYKDD